MERASASGGGSSDFVKKLYKMLEDPTYRHIVRWNDMGDSFIVLDNTEFTRNVLPRHFKHSNFASFVRQLNKYDFHKIRNTDEPGGSQYGEQAWEFKHPNFLMHNRDQLENIRRKAPAARKPAQKVASEEDPSALQAAFAQIEELQIHLQQFRDAQKGIDHQLERNDTMCQALVAQVGNMHKKLMDYEDLIQRLMVQLAEKEVELRNIARRNPHLMGLQVSEYNEYRDGDVSRGKGEGENGEGDNEQSDDDEDDEDDEDGYDDMEEDMDEDIDENEGEDRSEEHLPTSASIPSQGLTPFIMDHSTPLGQNYDQVERDTSAPGVTALEIEEILEGRNWAIGPFDPGGVSNNNTSDEQQSKRMFDLLLSKSTRESQSWLKLPGLNPKIQSQAKTSDGLSVVLSSAAASSHSETSPSGTIEDATSVNEPTEADSRRYKGREGNDGDTVQVSKPRPAASVPPQVPVSSENAVKDVITASGHAIYLPPITEVGSLPSEPSLMISQIKQSLDAANLDKGKGKEIPVASLERRPPPTRQYTAPILVVDDDPMCRRLLMLFFSYNKQEVDCASDGISAVEKVNRHKYSIIFMDVILPLLDGVSATKLMRKADKETPIVCLASTTNEVDTDRYKRCGMNIILSKPFGFKKLYETMLQIMPESAGWAIPRGLRAKKNRPNNQQRAGIQGFSSDGQDGKSGDKAAILGSAGPNNFTGMVGQTNSRDVIMTDAGSRQDGGPGADSLISAPIGPFCLRPMSIASLINEKNYDPKKREHTEMDKQDDPGTSEGAGPKKRRIELTSENVTPEVPPLLEMDTSSTVNSFDVLLTMENPSSLPGSHQTMLGPTISSTPTFGSFDCNLEVSGLQDDFLHAPVEHGYIVPKTKAAVEQPEPYQVQYQATEDEGLSLVMGNVPQPFELSETSLLYDSYQVE